MRWNATYRYRTATTNGEFVDGGICQVDNGTMEQLRDAEWGKEKVFLFDVYMRNSHNIGLSVADAVEITMHDGQQFVSTVVGIDFTDRRVYALRISTNFPSFITNGSVSYKFKTGGGLDPVTGFPVPATSTWGEDIPCRWTTVSLNLLARDIEEHYIEAKYAIYVAGKRLPSEQLKLGDNDGNVLGEFSVISYEYMELNGMTKILV